MIRSCISSLKSLKSYCEAENFKGWDPYDGLNSRLFQALPFLKESALCRLVMIQSFKRSPVNLRRLAMVPKEHNAKGIGLFLQGYCNLYKVVSKCPELTEYFGSAHEIRSRIDELAELLISIRSEGFSGACWGYNFDWQARRLFLFPKNTPTVVATCFCTMALMDAYEVTGNSRYLDIALTSADFVLNDLHRTEYEGGFLFSYSPLSGNDTVFNASLLGSRLLARCFHYSRNHEYADAAKSSVEACCKAQRKDGSWVYGLLPVQEWVDSFHTGYNLSALYDYERYTGDLTYHDNLMEGLRYYISNFFLEDGTPKYYNDRIYPIDIHCPGQLLVTIHELNKIDTYQEIVDNVLNWTIANMQDRRGFFYYQLKKGINSRIPYMRWSNAFMFNALSCYIWSICGTKELR